MTVVVKGDRVLVSHVLGDEAGVVVGTRGPDAPQVVVRFYDGTISTWAADKVRLETEAEIGRLREIYLDRGFDLLEGGAGFVVETQLCHRDARDNYPALDEELRARRMSIGEITRLVRS